MSLKFAKITEDNVEDLISFCGNMPGMDKNPFFKEGRQARREWLAETIKKFGTVGMLAYGADGRTLHFSSNACPPRYTPWVYFRRT